MESLNVLPEDRGTAAVMPVQAGNFCGLVLAGGEGRRLQPFIRSLGKKRLPKQYVNFIGSRSMLEHTIHRAEKLIPRHRVVTIVNENHLKHAEVRRQLAKRPEETVLVQPENKETGTGILFALTHLDRRHRDCSVLVLPSDHFVAEEDRLMMHARWALDMVKRDPAKLVLLGVEPDVEEPEYGYILTGKKLLREAPVVAEISWFIEKPDLETAKRLTRQGGLWNTMIMAFRGRTLLHWVNRLAPEIYRHFSRLGQAIGSSKEAAVSKEIYRELRPVNFSKDLLEPMVARYPSSVVALPVRQVLWSDWGTAERVIGILRQTGYLSRLNGNKAQQPIAESHRRPPYVEGISKRIEC